MSAGSVRALILVEHHLISPHRRYVVSQSFVREPQSICDFFQQGHLGSTGIRFPRMISVSFLFAYQLNLKFIFPRKKLFKIHSFSPPLFLFSPLEPTLLLKLSQVGADRTWMKIFLCVFVDCSLLHQFCSRNEENNFCPVWLMF